MSATITVETGSQVSGANSYVTAAELDTYADERGKTISGTQQDLLIQAMDYLEAQNFIGTRRSFDDQPLQWPRYDAIIDGHLLNNNEIPTLLKEAQMAVALSIDEGNGPERIIERSTKREKVGSLEVEYTDGARGLSRDPTINRKLTKLVRGGASGLTFQVDRG